MPDQNHQQNGNTKKEHNTMRRPPTEFYGYALLADAAETLDGRLIVLEGTDGVGRSSQIALLREWLEGEGYAVTTSRFKQGKLAGKGLTQAMTGHMLNETTMNLLYATDFADRLESEIIPALRAGFVVLTDRYFYSVLARAQVRGADPTWLRNLFSFAIKPDAVFYMHASIESLVPRVLSDRGFDYYESGMDFQPERDYYASFVTYQEKLLAEYEEIAEEYDFQRIDADRSMHEVFLDLQSRLRKVVNTMKPR